MSVVFNNLSRSIKILFADKVILSLSMMPIMIGGVLYYFLGKWLYDLIMQKGQAFISDHLGDGSGAGIIFWILQVIAFVLLFFIVNWTFVMVVSVFASPFNDAISSRIEKRHKGIKLLERDQAFKEVFKKLFSIIWNELKKVTFIISLTVLSLILSLIPILAPITIIFSAILLAIQFVDYSWSRHEWRAGECIKDIFTHFFTYLIAGGIFVILMSLPGINLLALPVAVIYFTLIFVDKNQAKLNNV